MKDSFMTERTENLKLFTVDEANRLLPAVEPILMQIRSCHLKVQSFRENAAAAAESAELGGGGMEGGSNYVQALIDLSKQAIKIDEMGVQIKDFARGLIDFPSQREDRVVLLCWQLDDGPQIEWWHELEGGFGGRQRL
jgi:hypothetical protein